MVVACLRKWCMACFSGSCTSLKQEGFQYQMSMGGGDQVDRVNHEEMLHFSITLAPACHLSLYRIRASKERMPGDQGFIDDRLPHISFIIQPSDTARRELTCKASFAHQTSDMSCVYHFRSGEVRPPKRYFVPKSLYIVKG